jgi:hypothetical protein
MQISPTKEERNLMETEKKDGLREFCAVFLFLRKSTWLSCSRRRFRHEQEMMMMMMKNPPILLVCALHENGKLVNYPTLHLIFTNSFSKGE